MKLAIEATPEEREHDEPVCSLPMPPRGLAISHLIIATLSIFLLFSGGVYWFLHANPGPVTRPAGTVVNVRIIEPAPSVPSQDSAKLSSSVASPTPHLKHDARVDNNDVQPHSVGEGKPHLLPVAVTDTTPPPGTMPFQAETSTATSAFQHDLLLHIERYRHYPEAARTGRLQGIVKVLFAMDRSGQVLGAWVKASSGSAVLDQEAISTIRRAQPLPLIPPELPDRVTILLPVEFAAP